MMIWSSELTKKRRSNLRLAALEIGITSQMKGLHVPYNNLHLLLVPIEMSAHPFFYPPLHIILSKYDLH